LSVWFGIQNDENKSAKTEKWMFFSAPQRSKKEKEASWKNKLLLSIGRRIRFFVDAFGIASSAGQESADVAP